MQGDQSGGTNGHARGNSAALVAWMRGKKLKPEELGRALGVGRSTVYAWRKGYPPSRRNAALLDKLSEGAVPASGWD